MASHIKDSSRVENESCEKFLINLVNEHGSQFFPSFFCNGKKRVVAKDLDKLNRQQFVELIKFMFQGYTTAKISAALDKEDNARTVLNSFADFLPNPRIHYEAKPALLYQALKEFFPADSDVLLPSVIIRPAGDPQRTRKVLKYLCSLLLFVDSIGHDLRDVRDELEAQAQEKNKVKNQIEETTEKINSRAIDLDMWKGEVAVLEKQSCQKKEDIQSLSMQTAHREEEVKRAERQYNKLVEKNRSTQRAVAATTKEIESLKKKVVHNEDNIVHEYHSELTQLQELARQREVLGQQIEECRKNSEKVGEVTEACVSCISELADMVQLMEELSKMQLTVQCSKSQKDEKAQAVRELEKKLKEKQDRCSVSAPQQAMDAYRAELQRLGILEKELQDCKLRAENLTNEHNCLGVELRKETNVRPNQRTQMTKLTERIQIGEEYIREEIPAMSTRIHETIQQTLEDLEDSFEAI